MTEIKRGEKYYIEVEVDSEHNENAVWVTHPDHPANEYSGICVYKKYLIPQERLKRLENISKFADGLVYITMHDAEVALEEDGFPVRPAKHPFFSSCITREEADQIIINAMRTKHRYDR